MSLLLNLLGTAVLSGTTIVAPTTAVIGQSPNISTLDEKKVDEPIKGKLKINEFFANFTKADKWTDSNENIVNHEFKVQWASLGVNQEFLKNIDWNRSWISFDVDLHLGYSTDSNGNASYEVVKKTVLFDKFKQPNFNQVITYDQELSRKTNQKATQSSAKIQLENLQTEIKISSETWTKIQNISSTSNGWSQLNINFKAINYNFVQLNDNTKPIDMSFKIQRLIDSFTREYGIGQNVKEDSFRIYWADLGISVKDWFAIDWSRSWIDLKVVLDFGDNTDQDNAWKKMYDKNEHFDNLNMSFIRNVRYDDFRHRSGNGKKADHTWEFIFNDTGLWLNFTTKVWTFAHGDQAWSDASLRYESINLHLVQRIEK